MAKRYGHYGVSLLLVQALLACSPQSADNIVLNEGQADTVAAASNSSAPATDTQLVVAFGDSLYAGYNLDVREGFAPVLERALAAQGVAAQVVNAGVSGDTTSAGRQRLGFTLDGLARKPDLVIVGLGGNDMLRGLSPEQTRENLDAILAELKQRGIPAMLTGMTAAPNLGRDFADPFNAIFPDLAKKYGVPLYPFFLDGVIGDREMMLADGIHPNPQGVEKIVAKVGPAVAQALKVQGS